MADPISGGIGKASEQMMKQLQKQMQDQVQNQQGPEKANFQNMVAQGPSQVQGTQNVTQAQQVNDVQKTTETMSAADVLKAAQQKGITDPTKAQKVTKSASGRGLRKMLSQIVEGQNKLDDIIKMATSGKVYGQQDLLAIQASVHKFSQELELTSKVVEKATSGIKQTMSTQV